MSMGKDFSAWHNLKSKVNNQHTPLYFHERDIWWCTLGCNIGSEEDGKGAMFSRPVLIIRKFGPDLCLAIPLTSKPKTGIFYYVFKFSKNRVRATTLLSQVRAIDTRRLQRWMGKVEQADFDLIKQKLFALLST